MRCALFVALLFLPGLSAASITWSAPDGIASDHPVFAAAVSRGPDGRGQAHVDMELQVWLDGFLLVDSRDVHEHDGVFTMVFTPPGHGALRLVAIVDGQPTEHPIVVGATMYNATGFGQASLHVDGTTWSIEQAPAHAALFEVPAPEGHLSARAWSHGAAADASPDAAVQALLVTSPSDPQARGAVMAPSPSITGPAVQAQGPPAAQFPECGPEIVTDPDSVLSPGLAWQSGTDVRVTHAGPATYQTLGAEVVLPVGGLGVPSITMTAEDPFGQFTFRPATPGPGRLLVTADTTCQLVFQVLPGPAPTGRLEVTPVKNPVGVSIGFAALGIDDTLLPHYEFDTRVVRLQDDLPGRLAWAGKLHGHDGQATLHLNFLPPGDYEIVTFASPQALDTPGLAATGVHRIVFTVAPYGGAADVANGTIPAWSTVEPEEIPAPDRPAPLPAGWLVAAMAAALLVRRRR